MRSASGGPGVCFYISDFGYGHAARQIAIIRRLLDDAPHLRVYVKAEAPFAFLRRSLPETVRVIRRRNDPGLVMRGMAVDVEATLAAVRAWVRGWPHEIAEERCFCADRGIDVLIADIPPQIFLLAADLGVPGLAVTNFLWSEPYGRLFGMVEEIAAMRLAYAAATELCILPLAVGLTAGREVGLVARKVGRARETIRHSLGVRGSEPLIFLGTGKSVTPDTGVFAPIVRELDEAGIRVLTPAGARLAHTREIPAEEPESQDYIAACDGAITKAGYSTIAEALQARVPMLLFVGPVEGEPLVDEVAGLGIGRRLPASAFVEGGWRERIISLIRGRQKFNRLPERLSRNGTVEVAAEIVRLAEASS